MRKKLFLFKTFFIIAVLAGFIFLSSTKPFLRARLEIVRLFAPVAKIGWRWRESEDTALLKEKDQAIKGLQFELGNLWQENLSLKEALSFKGKIRNLFLQGAGVIFYSKDFGREFIIIDRGAKDGLRNGDLVIDEKGILVGVLQETTDNFSKVDLAFNPGRNFEVEIRLAGNETSSDGTENARMQALAEGLGARTWALRLIPTSTSLKTGELVSLTGGELRFILLGEVVNFSGGKTFLEAKVVSLARPERLANVLVFRSAFSFKNQ